MPFIGQTSVPSPDLVVQVECAEDVQVKDWVRLSLSGTAIKASATSLEESDILGIVEAKLGSTMCRVRTGGKCTIDYRDTLSIGARCFLSDRTPGEMMMCAPTAPSTIVYEIAQVINASTLVVSKKMRMQRASS